MAFYILLFCILLIATLLGFGFLTDWDNDLTTQCLIFSFIISILITILVRGVISSVDDDNKKINNTITQEIIQEDTIITIPTINKEIKIFKSHFEWEY